jgi:hypothetical protein
MRLVQSIAGRRESADAQPATSTSSTRLLHHGQSADLEQISIVSSNATPSQVTYGTGLATANGPRIVPGDYSIQISFFFSTSACRAQSSRTHVIIIIRVI